MSRATRPTQARYRQVFMAALHRAARSAQAAQTQPFQSQEALATAMTAHFFRHWFREEGQSLIFVFRKNLRVTNIQFGEFLALIRTYARQGTNGALDFDLQFASVDDFNDGVKAMVAAFPGDSQQAFQFLADQYTPLLQRTIVLDCFFGSCALFVPPQLEIDISAVCGSSGYIQSAGHNVFVRKAYKATSKDFFRALDEHLAKSTPGERKIFFAPYTHEDFAETDLNRTDELRFGLEDLKIHIDKFYMGDSSLVSVLEEMGHRFKSLEIPRAAEVKDQHQEPTVQAALDRSRTLWLILDRATRGTSKHPEDTRYFICYEQRYVNENPFHLFDENKPAWVDHTTIPHTLMGAMINITRPWWPKNRPVRLADPFVGTGTTWLETLKFEHVIAECRDLNALTPQLVEDNLDFFSKSVDELDELLKDLTMVLEDNFSSTTPTAHLKERQIATEMGTVWSREFFDKVANNWEDCNFTAGQAKQLSQGPFLGRLLFYLMLRTARRNINAFRRKAIGWPIAFRKELSTLISQTARLKRQREREHSSAERADTKHTLAQGKYSTATTIPAETFKRVSKDLLKKQVVVKDALELPRDYFDVVVTDPPYGFNTSDNLQELAKLYSKMVPVFINSLNDDGQLVMAVPDWSHIGRQLPFFAMKNTVTQQVLRAAEEHGREVINAAFIVPRPGQLFRAPFYWESERALRRAILHFRIRKIRRTPPSKRS